MSPTAVHRLGGLCCGPVGAVLVMSIDVGPRRDHINAPPPRRARITNAAMAMDIRRLRDAVLAIMASSKFRRAAEAADERDLRLTNSFLRIGVVL